MNARLQKKIRQWERKQALKFSISEVKTAHFLKEIGLPVEKLSARAIGICKRNGLSTLEDLVDHYDAFETFQMFLGCGERTDKELIDFCKDSMLQGYRRKCGRCEYFLSRETFFV